MTHKHTYDEYGLCFECDKPEPKSPAERKRAERARRAKAGLVRFGTWLTPKECAAVQLYIAQMRKENKN